MKSRVREAAAVVALIMAFIGAAAPAATNAAPSKFVQMLCDSALPGGAAPHWSFQANPGVPLAPFEECASPGGALGIAQTGQTSATFASMKVLVPPTPGGFVEFETVAGISQGLSPGNHLSHIKVNGWPDFNSGESQRLFRLRTDSGGPAFFLDGDTGNFTILVSCDGNVGPCNGGILAAHNIAATQVDPHAPVIANADGSIFGGGTLRGHQDLSASATDLGGGVSRIEVIVNGHMTPGSPASCNLADVENQSYEGTAAVTSSPCPTALQGAWSLDTASFPFQDGENSVQVCASDYSTLTEANRTCTTAQTVTVDNSCAESPVSGGEILSAHFVRSNGDAITLPFGRPAKISGELTNNAGDAISGATVCVQMQTQGSRKGLRPIGTARTDAHGHFVYKVSPGPNRKVFVGYRHDRFQVARSLRFFSHARLKLTITPRGLPNGGEIEMRGKLPGPRAAGRVAVLQASALRSNTWYTFEKATTNRHGIFHARYRFDATPFTTIYRIRAVAPRQRAWPWETGYSKPVLVEVRGSSL